MWVLAPPESWDVDLTLSSRTLVLMPRPQLNRARERLVSLAGAGLGHLDYYAAAMEVVRTAIPYDAMCIGSVDPATNMITDSGKVDLVDEGDSTFLYHEYAVDDVNQYVDLAARDESASILLLSTGGDPARSARYRNVVKPVLGAEHELRGIARAAGLLWGAYSIYRDKDSTAFNLAEAEFMAGLEQAIAMGIRSAMVARVAQQSLESGEGPAVLVYDHRGRLLHATATAARRVADLGGELWGRTAVPVSSVVSALRAGRAVSRLRSRGADGCWYTIHAAPFTAGDAVAQIAVTIEQSRPPEVLPLIISGYGLSEREAEIVLLMLRGESTHAIAAALFLSPYTVQDHFKSIFEKVGVSSRREVATRIFFGQYAHQQGARASAAS